MERENLLRITAETDEAHLAVLLRPAQRGNCLVNDLLHLDELDVVTQDDVEVIGAEPVQTDIEALADAFGAEIEVAEIVAAELGAEQVLSRGTSRSPTPSSTSLIPRP